MSEKQEDKELREWTIEDELGNIIGDLSLISFVDNPAMEQDYILLSGDQFQLSKVEEEKQIVTGVALRVGFPVTQLDKNTGEIYDGYLDERQVRLCSELFLKNNNHQQTNLEHGKLLTKNEIDGVQVVRSWIVEDPECDASKALGFSNINKGDWYVSFKVENKAFWEFLKKKGKGGFSVEALFHHKMRTELSALRSKPLDVLVKEITFSKDLTDNQKEAKLKSLLFPEQA